MQAIAEPLDLSFDRVRFRSLLNGRIFSLTIDGDHYELVELVGSSGVPDVYVLYEGMDAFMVMNVIWKEVNDVRFQ